MRDGVALAHDADHAGLEQHGLSVHDVLQGTFEHVEDLVRLVNMLAARGVGRERDLSYLDLGSSEVGCLDENLDREASSAFEKAGALA